jgi:hypothetical protein
MPVWLSQIFLWCGLLIPFICVVIDERDEKKNNDKQ